MHAREPVLKPVPIHDLRPTQITVGLREVAAKRKRWELENTRHEADFLVANLGKLDQDVFWVVLDNKGWLHPFDEHGRRRDYSDIPGSIRDLVDDPFRSLAGELRRAGGFAKDTTPFSEFLWADFLRRLVKRKLVEDDFPQALAAALKLARTPEADYLPGWCGPAPED